MQVPVFAGRFIADKLQKAKWLYDGTRRVACRPMCPTGGKRLQILDVVVMFVNRICLLDNDL